MPSLTFRRTPVLVAASLSFPLVAQEPAPVLFDDPPPVARPVSGSPPSAAARGARAVLLLREGRVAEAFGVLGDGVGGKDGAEGAATVDLRALDDGGAALGAMLQDLRGRVAAGERFEVLAPTDEEGRIRPCRVMDLDGDPPTLALGRRGFEGRIAFADLPAWAFATAALDAGLGAAVAGDSRKAVLELLIAVDRLDADGDAAAEIDRRLRRSPLVGRSPLLGGVAGALPWLRALMVAERSIASDADVDPVATTLDRQLAALPADVEGAGAVRAALPGWIETAIAPPAVALGGLEATVTRVADGRFQISWDWRAPAQLADWLVVPGDAAATTKLAVDAERGEVTLTGRGTVRPVLQFEGPIDFEARLSGAMVEGPDGSPQYETRPYGRWTLAARPDDAGLAWEPLSYGRLLALVPDGPVTALPDDVRGPMERQMLGGEAPFRLAWSDAGATLSIGPVTCLTVELPAPGVGGVTWSQPFTDRDHAVAGTIRITGRPTPASLEFARGRVRARLFDRLRRWLPETTERR